MAQDLRKLFARERENKVEAMKEGHESRFLAKLEEKIPKKEVKERSNSFFWLRIAASMLILLGLATYFFFGTNGVEENPKTTIAEKDNMQEQYQGISLGDLSPDLKKVESYYVTNINLELSDLEFSGDNKTIIDSYMLRLSELDKEYKRLTVELNEIGPNDDTINALIQNLQLRLQLLQKLKTKLNQLKSSKNEQKSENIV